MLIGFLIKNISERVDIIESTGSINSGEIEQFVFRKKTKKRTQNWNSGIWTKEYRTFDFFQSSIRFKPNQLDFLPLSS
jgi:hypothetical protein